MLLPTSEHKPREAALDLVKRYYGSHRNLPHKPWSVQVVLDNG